MPWEPTGVLDSLTNPLGSLTDLLEASLAHWGPERHTGALPTYWGPNGPIGGFTDLMGT